MTHVPAAPATTICHGDWLALAATLKPSSIGLLYADPPFNTGRRKATPPLAARRGRQAHAVYEDSWPTTQDYIRWLRSRLEATLPAMRPSGNILIHCDWRASHHIRILLDDLVGEHCFRNHIIWHYGLGGSSPRMFARKHDDILFYCINPDKSWFDPPMIPAASRKLAGTLKKSTDVLDVPSLNNMASERTGYPTQKPIALLNILIRACCAPGDCVLDPCCGSGTTLVAAAGSGRCSIGFDMSEHAVSLARSRISGTECH